MKKICISFLLLFIIVLTMFCGSACSGGDVEYFRIHVRANSDDENDQGVKLAVKEKLVAELTNLLCGASDMQGAIDRVSENKSALVELANDELRARQKTYLASVSVKKEYFPTRVYEGHTLRAGEYNALVVTLGEGRGANWWCVLYPPLCVATEQVTYKSYIVEKVKQAFC